MDVLEAIRARRTIRKFKPDPIPEPVLADIYEAAMWAPSHGNTQPWEFVVVGPQARARLLALFQVKADEALATPDLPEPRRRGLLALKENFGGAPYMVGVVSRAGHEALEAVENPASTAAAAHNMCLAAWSHGVGAVWLSLGAAPPTKGILAVEQDASVVALLALGYPELVPPPPPREAPGGRIRSVP
jgi:nitroreductase